MKGAVHTAGDLRGVVFAGTSVSAAAHDARMVGCMEFTSATETDLAFPSHSEFTILEILGIGRFHEN